MSPRANWGMLLTVTLLTALKDSMSSGWCTVMQWHADKHLQVLIAGTTPHPSWTLDLLGGTGICRCARTPHLRREGPLPSLGRLAGT
ncbi:hypothetical protein GE09DRAFT_248887 [Coniochaeta sp. 2T2.1]|nr:hypothetical protein GE09DRAFT_248887 [Coniochaeta sp. 2T2.1]